MNGQERISPRQFTAAVFVSALSPLIRRFPRALAAHAGHSAYLAIAFSAVPAAAAIAAAFALFRRQPEGSGLSDVFTSILGRTAGRLLTGLYGLWFVFYAGFLLRSGTDRFLTTVYTGARPWVFIAVMALLCGLAALRDLPPLARTAMLFRPVLLAVLALAAALAAKDLDPALLLPVTKADLRPNAAAAAECANILSVAFFFGFFGRRLDRRLTLRDVAPRFAALLGVITLMTVGCIGMFGAELTAQMRFPFFMLVRDLSVLGALERLEPVVVALWVFSDFVFISLLLLLAAGTLRDSCAPARAEAPGRWLPLLCTAAAVGVALALPASEPDIFWISERLVPLLSALFAFGPLPPLLLIGALRKKL